MINYQVNQASDSAEPLTRDQTFRRAESGQIGRRNNNRAATWLAGGPKPSLTAGSLLLLLLSFLLSHHLAGSQDLPARQPATKGAKLAPDLGGSKESAPQWEHRGPAGDSRSPLSAHSDTSRSADASTDSSESSGDEDEDDKGAEGTESTTRPPSADRGAGRSRVSERPATEEEDEEEEEDDDDDDDDDKSKLPDAANKHATNLTSLASPPKPRASGSARSSNYSPFESLQALEEYLKLGPPPNENSGVEKGTKTQLPGAKDDDDDDDEKEEDSGEDSEGTGMVRRKGGTKDGVARSSDDPRTKTERPTALKELRRTSGARMLNLRKKKKKKKKKDEEKEKVDQTSTMRPSSETSTMSPSSENSTNQAEDYERSGSVKRSTTSKPPDDGEEKESDKKNDGSDTDDESQADDEDDDASPTPTSSTSTTPTPDDNEDNKDNEVSEDLEQQEAEEEGALQSIPTSRAPNGRRDNGSRGAADVSPPSPPPSSSPAPASAAGKMAQPGAATTGAPTTAAGKPASTAAPGNKGETEAIEGAGAGQLAAQRDLSKKVDKLGEQTKGLNGHRNSTIMVNGRKFDQVQSIECVDEKFYQLLMKDLKLVEPELRVDHYGSYYDSEYAKTIAALIDTPAKHGQADSGGSKEKAQGVIGSDFGLQVDILAEVRKFWKETYDTYSGQSARLAGSKMGQVRQVGEAVVKGSAKGNEKERAGRKRKRRATAEVRSRPDTESALANHKYLLARLEGLKVMLVNGEEALLVLNNKVKKLNQAVSEAELQRALCSCLTARGGVASLMIMNELFVDRESAKLVKDLPGARQRGEEAARDAAEFCSYWYGDTLRSEAKQKELQIKRLVLHLAKQKKTVNKTSIIKTSKLVRHGSATVRETQTRVVTTIVEMTTLWLPKLAHWIRDKLNGTETLKGMLGAAGANRTEVHTRTVTQAPVVTSVEQVPEGAKGSQVQAGKKGPGQVDSGPGKKRSRRWAFSKAFDEEPGNYGELEESASDSLSRRWRRDLAAAKTSTSTGRPKSTTTHKTLANGRPLKGSKDIKSTQAPSETTTPVPTPAPLRTSTQRPPDTKNTTTDKVKAHFEERVTDRSAKCASDGFVGLLWVGRQQNELMYEEGKLGKEEDRYISSIVEAFNSSFARLWEEKRNLWSSRLEEKPSVRTNSTSGGGGGGGGGSGGKNLDEEIDDTFEASLGSYERGAKLGFNVGKFIGEKAARQWPDPAELNTFSYDSIFWAGSARGYPEERTKELERRIVTEAAKRAAFTEANKAAFGRTLHSAYLNGAFIVPRWGLLHGQRTVAKRAADEGAKVGYEAASQASRQFAPQAIKFFRLHDHQRSLSAPYKSLPETSDKWAGLKEQIGSVQLESQLSNNVSTLAVECGSKSGALMGALMGLLVVPEAFETYTRFRGSLEAIESEFNQFKLGALRGYELGETWAYLNYTAELKSNLKAMKLAQVETAAAGSGDGRPQVNKPPGGPDAAGRGTGRPGKPLLGSLNDKAPERDMQSLFETPGQDGQGETNTNNIFQFMVLNYGTHLVANHSHKHLLKLRPLIMDEQLIRDMKVQAGDLIANPSSQSGDGGSAAEEENDHFDRLFELGHYIGDLKGEFNSMSNNKLKRPIKVNIIDLGPRLEFAPEFDTRNASVAGANSTSDSGKAISSIPLTATISNKAKVFMKFSVARRRKPQADGDDVSRYLNKAEFDEGDGYLAGSYSLSSTRLGANSSSASPEVAGDSFSLEVAALDELFEQIEQPEPAPGAKKGGK